VNERSDKPADLNHSDSPRSRPAISDLWQGEADYTTHALIGRLTRLHGGRSYAAATVTRRNKAEGALTRLTELRALSDGRYSSNLHVTSSQGHFHRALEPACISTTLVSAVDVAIYQSIHHRLSLWHLSQPARG
jgi:hypothetical protein